MPTYQIKDPQTGKTVTVRGQQPPTQQDAQTIFTNAGLRSEPKEKSLIQKIGGSIAPTLSSLSQSSGAFLSRFTPAGRAADESMERAEAMNTRLQDAARAETDPARKKFLMDAALSSSDALGDIGVDSAKGYQEAAGITDREMDMSQAEYTGRKAVGAAAETASIMAPFSMGGKSLALSKVAPSGLNVARATRLGRIGQSALMGGGQGALMGFGKSVGEGDDMGEVAKDTLVGGAVGGVTGATVQGAIETPGLIKEFVGTSGRKIDQKLIDLYRSTLKQNVKDKTFYRQYKGGEDGVVRDALAMDVPTTKDAVIRELDDYGPVYNEKITTLARRAEQQGRTIDITTAFNRARAKASQLFSHDETLQQAGDAWFEKNAIKYGNQTKARPISANKLRIKFDKKVGDMVIGDINAAQDQARKLFASELREQFKDVVGFEGKQAIKRYQLLAGLAEAMMKEPKFSLPETTMMLAGSALSPWKIPGAVAGVVGGVAIRSPGLKRKLAKEVIKSGATTMKPAIQSAKASVGNLLSPFTAGAVVDDETE